MGKFSFPIAIMISLLIWIASYLIKPYAGVTDSFIFWKELSAYIPSNLYGGIINFLLCGLVIYLLLELNNAYSLIRLRTNIQYTLYILIMGICPFMHPLQPSTPVVICVLMAIYLLFHSYQRPHPVGCIFHSHLFLSLGSLLFPQLLFGVPIFLIGAYNFRILTFKTFFAALLGISLPYWFLFGHAFFYNRMELFYAPFQELVTFYPINYTYGNNAEFFTGAFLLLLFIIGAVHSLVTGYQDKLRTRSYLNFFILLEFTVILFCVLQPQHFLILFHLFVIGCSLFTAHLFALSHSKSTHILFIISIVTLTALGIFNLWTY